MAHHHSPASTHSGMGSAIAASLTVEPAPSSTPAIAYSYGIGAAPEEESQATALTVNVTGLQYAWLFNYPDNGAISGELHVPVGQSVQLNISAQDVIHSFWAPQLRLKQDAIPGQDTHFNLWSPNLETIRLSVQSYAAAITVVCGPDSSPYTCRI